MYQIKVSKPGFSIFLILIIWTWGLGAVKAQSISNPEFKAQIDSIQKIDRQVRAPRYSRAHHYYYKNKKADASLKKSRKFKKAAKIAQEWELTDSLNIQKLLSLIEQYGFPSKDRVGRISYGNAIIIMMHYDKDIQNKVLRPILEEALSKKEILPRDFAVIIDRHLVYNGAEPIYYGFLPCPFLDLPEKEKKKVLDARHDIGLYDFRFKCGLFHKWQVIE